MDQRTEPRPRPKRRHRAPVRHWLITIMIASDTHMHGYLMSDDKRQVHVAVNRMLDEAEKAGSRYPLMNMVLLTTLSRDTELVREIVSRRSPEVKHLLATATDFHFSAWAMHVDDPDDARLMALH